MKIKLVCVVMACLLASLTKAQTNFLISGEPMRNGTSTGIGNFALPSISGLVIGTALVNNDEFSDLFMQSDSWAPGTYLHHFKKLTAKGEPVFSQGIKLKLPFEDKGENKASIIQTPDQEIYGFWRFGGKLLKSAVFNKNTNAFEGLQDIKVNGLPWGLSTFGVIRTLQGKYLFVFTIPKENKATVKIGTDSAYYTPEGFWPNELGEVGIYGAVADDLKNLNKLDAQPLTELNQTYFGISGYTSYQANGEQYLICGTRFGNIHAYKVDKEKLYPTNYVVDKNHILQRSPSVNGYVTYFKGPANVEGILGIWRRQHCFLPEQQAERQKW
ncbi:hypothetical protein [Pedobacter sp. ASV28]|uniref:hypothetical protein n=1 Tax=Pedobacter sp. ASV28 TaxID=2795123 RepID=UPI0018EB7118|nr:hypothetical protein [Pedobacter sp. ASV28]